MAFQAVESGHPTDDPISNGQPPAQNQFPKVNFTPLLRNHECAFQHVNKTPTTVLTTVTTTSKSGERDTTESPPRT